jgi:hypothetical protein
MLNPTLARILAPGRAEFRRTRHVDDGGQRLWAQHMSDATRFFAGVNVIVWLSITWAGIYAMTSQNDPSGVLGVLFGTAGVWFGVAVGLRPVIEVRLTGVLVRNIIWEYWVPWEAIDDVVAHMRVYLVLTSGKRITAWAVQKANAAAMFNKKSRTDWVTEWLLKTRSERLAALPTAAPKGVVIRQLARIPGWMALAYCLFVGTIAVITSRS